MEYITFERIAVRRLVWTSTWFNILISVQVFFGLIYAYVTGAIPTRLTHFFIPFVWITVAVWVLWHTRPISPKHSFQLIAIVLAATYFLILLYLSGLLGQSTTHLEPLAGPNGMWVTEGQSLGWGPFVLYTNEWITLTVIPYQVIGLFALSYLVYDALLDLARSTIGGIIGIAACPACVGPLLAPLLASGAGGSSLVLILGVYGYEIATILFITAVTVLYHRYAFVKFYQNLRA
ncbi:DUF7546 family protein [Natrialba sp. SSL1]|uniref:DUF7546 family protein n=1 Tax=Natrialba sp. SSL1 TaxID=1869245 RepID=UPI0008F93FFE|nr:hypothetical protein [Natrialba sp. SSL1]OIB57349.1 hypothetical protein BBD46_02375 [Natrialba sp. SSL1]